MVTGVNASMPTGGVTVGATPPAQPTPQEAVQPPVPQTTVTVTAANATTATAAAAATTATSTTTTTTTMSTTTGSPAPAQAAAPAPRRSSENRRSNKPIMEKKRRQRINNCLNDLKALLLDAMKKDPARHSKLEKADILEMTVKHFETLQRQQAALASATDPTVLNKFRAGFSECASEVGRFPGLDAAAKRRLLAHLASCMAAADSNGGVVQPSAQQSAQSVATTTTQLQVHILPQVDASGIQVQQSNGIVYMNANGTALQLVPTRLSNGNIALVAAGAAKAPSSIMSPASSPSSSPVPTSPLPTLIPIPQRTASTASASSSASSSSSTSTSVASPVAFEAPPSNYREQSQSPVSYTRDAATSPASGYTSDPEFDPRVYSPPLQKPLSLVMRKSVIKESIDEKCWRPW